MSSHPAIPKVYSQTTTCNKLLHTFSILRLQENKTKYEKKNTSHTKLRNEIFKKVMKTHFTVTLMSDSHKIHNSMSR